jgi:hypothetical protein
MVDYRLTVRGAAERLAKEDLRVRRRQAEQQSAEKLSRTRREVMTLAVAVASFIVSAGSLVVAIIALTN